MNGFDEGGLVYGMCIKPMATIEAQPNAAFAIITRVALGPVARTVGEREHE